MDYLQSITKFQEKIAKEQLQKEERRIIEDFVAAGKATTQGMNSAINAIQVENALRIAQNRPKQLVIANAATAAAIRKQFTREEVEIIITPAAETLTAYIVKDEALKQQLLAGIEQRGVLTMQVAINLTPVLITLIICVFLYAMCKMARQDEKKKKRQEIEVPEFMNRRNMHVVGNGQEGAGKQ